MKFSKQISADELVILLKNLGYEITNRQDEHIRLSATIEDAVTGVITTHQITIPNNNPILPVTLSAIVGEVASHSWRTKEKVSQLLFGQDSSS
jgi:hypothetical protein